jgi:hypothetical protein
MVDWVDVVLDDEVCATATPVITARAVTAANQYLIMPLYSEELSASGNRLLFRAMM